MKTNGTLNVPTETVSQPALRHSTIVSVHVQVGTGKVKLKQDSEGMEEGQAISK